MTDHTFQAAVYVRRMFSDLLCPDDKELTSVEQLDEIRKHLEGKPDVVFAAAFTDGKNQKQQAALKAFQRMMPQLETRKFDCLVLYSIELFGNSAQENRHCLLTLFPLWKIRVICIKEDYDSLTSGDAESGYSRLSQLVEQAEASENARRIKAELCRRRSTGKSAVSYCPYGYLPGEEDASEYLPDPECVDVVKSIFREFLAGRTCSQIARYLTEQNIPSPSKRREMRGYQFQNTVATGYWHPTTVKSILMNPVYTGDLLLGSYRSTTYLSLRDAAIQEITPKQMIENHHVPLITRDDYEKAQLILEAEAAERPLKSPQKRFPQHPYRNLVRCSECGALMLYKQRNLSGKNPYVVYVCATGDAKGPDYCSRHATRFDYVDKLIRTALETEIQLANSVYAQIETGTGPTVSKQVEDSYKQQMDVYLEETRSVSRELQKLYANFSVFSISPDEYYRQKEELTEQSREKGQLLTEALAQLRDYRSIFTMDNPWLKLYRGKTLPEVITPAIAKELIEQVLISPQEEVTVKFKHQNWREKLLEGIAPASKKED